MIESCKLLGDVERLSLDGKYAVIQGVIKSFNTKKKSKSKIKDNSKNEYKYLKFLDVEFNLLTNQINFNIRDARESDAKDYIYVGNAKASNSKPWRLSSTKNDYLDNIGEMLKDFRYRCCNVDDDSTIEFVDKIIERFIINSNIQVVKNNKAYPLSILDFEKLSFVSDIEKCNLKNEGEYRYLDFSTKEQLDEFIADALQIKGLKREDITLYTCSVITEEGKKIYICQTDIYKDILADELSGNNEKKSNKKQKTDESTAIMCSLCGEAHSMGEFTLTHKIFQRTNVSWAYKLEKKNYDKSFGLCSECYKSVSIGENVLNERFSINIGGNTVFIAPKCIDFNTEVAEMIQELDILSKIIKTQDKYYKALGDIKIIAEDEYNLKHNAIFDMYFYKKSNSATKIKQSIYNVDLDYFLKVINSFKKYKPFYTKNNENNGMNLNSIYYIYESSDSEGDKKQAARLSARDFSFIFDKRKISRALILRDAYIPIKRAFYSSSSSNKDYEANDKVDKLNFYLNRLEELDLLQKTEDTTIDVDLLNGLNEDLVAKIVELKLTSFEAGLFLLGDVVNSIASVQSKLSEHKAILNAINMRGMCSKDVDTLISKVILKSNELAATKKPDCNYLKSVAFSITLLKAQELINVARKNGAFNKYTKEEVLNCVYMGYLNSIKQSMLNKKTDNENIGGNSNEDNRQ